MTRRAILLLLSSLFALSAWAEGGESRVHAPGIFNQLPFLRLLDQPFEGFVINPSLNLNLDVRPTGAAEAEYQRYLLRVGPDGTIPDDAIWTAHEQRLLMPFAGQSDFQPADGGIFWQWEYLGPGNIGGRVRSFVFQGSGNMLLGAVSGGIWKSNSSGTDWTHLDDFLWSLKVVTMARSPYNGNVIYVGTGEVFPGAKVLPGAGMFKSYDGGLSWERLWSTSTWRFVNRVVHHPFIDNTLFAVVSNSNTQTDTTKDGVWKSVNGGETWNRVLAVSGAVDVDICSTAWANVLVGTMTDVYLSKNHGDTGTWNEITNGGPLPNNTQRCEVAFGHHESMWVSMNRNDGEVWMSANGDGFNWTRISTGLEYLKGAGNQGNYNNTLWALQGNYAPPLATDLVIFGGIDLYRLWKDITGTWRSEKISNWWFYHNGQPLQSAHADQHYILPNPNFSYGNPNGTRDFYVANDGGIQRIQHVDTVTPISGWLNYANNLGITQFYAAAVSPDGSVFIGGSQDNSVSRGYQGQPNNWYQAFTGDGGYCAINPNNPSIMYSETQFLNVMKSTDGGTTWISAVTGLSDAGDSGVSPFIAPLVMDPNNPDTLYGGSTRIWRTTNGAGNWSLLLAALGGDPSPQCSTIEVAKGNSNVLWVGYNSGTVLRSVNGGSSWTTVDNNQTGTNPITQGGAVTDIAINPNNHNEVAVTIGGFHQQQVWYTNNNGQTWSLRVGSGVNQLPQIHCTSVVWHPNKPNWLYVSSDLGIYASVDVGVSWNRAPRNVFHEGPINGEVSQLFWDGRESLYAATYGRGLWRVWVPTTIYVDRAHNGTENGRLETPWNSVIEADTYSAADMVYSIKTGNYAEGQKTYRKKSKWVARDGSARVR
ncbi:MAG: hypothetical protein KIT45_04765 [Fimbriimonadia bacterium]|nr:hypothetical protein [Fimbriimonadia bacterium]